jgi:hypothetical protein
LLEPVSPGDKSRKIPEHPFAGKHCTLTLHVKAADFRSPIFYSKHAALLRTGCVAMQRDAAQENNATGLPGMLLDAIGANALPDPRGHGEPKKNEPEGM